MAKAERTIVKQVENAIWYSDGSILLKNVRFSYPHLGEPYESEGEDGSKKLKFTCKGMLPKKTHLAAKNLVKAAIEKMIADNEVKIPTDRWFLTDGDKSEHDTEDGYWLVASSENRRPIARDRKAVALEPDEADELFYGGCWGNMLVRPWYFNGSAKNSKKTHPKRICCGLVSVQFVKNDEPFGESRINDDGVFDEVEDDDFGGSQDDEDDL